MLPLLPASLHIEFPMLFEISNVKEQRVSHCGVLEFVAEEGIVYMPYWVSAQCPCSPALLASDARRAWRTACCPHQMMQNLLLAEGDIIKFKSTSLPKGTYVKLRPQSKDFLDISNPKAVLETTLRRYSCLTTGDSILINYNNKRFFIDIVETKPQRAVTIIEARALPCVCTKPKSRALTGALSPSTRRTARWTSLPRWTTSSRRRSSRQLPQPPRGPPQRQDRRSKARHGQATP